MPESTSFDFPVRDTAVRMELASDISQSDTTLPVDQVVGFGDSDAPFLIKIWAPQSGEFREDFIEYAVVTSVDAANNSLDVRRDVENIGAVSASQGNLVQPMTLRASDIDEFGEKRLDKLKLAVDTGKAENVTSDSVDFVAEFLEFDPSFFDENSASVKFEYGETGNGFSNVFDPQRNPSTPKKISESLIVGFDGSEVSYSPLTQSSDEVSGVSIGYGYVAYGGYDTGVYLHGLNNGNEVSYSPLTQSSDNIRSVDIGEGYVAYGGSDDNTYIHNLNSGSLKYTLSQNPSNVLDVSIDQAYVAYSEGNNNCYVHNLGDGSLEYTLTEAGSNVQAVAIGERYIAYGDQNGQISVHNLNGGSLEYTLTQSSDRILDVAIGEGYVGYGGQDNNCYVHDLSDGSLVYTLSQSLDDVSAVGIGEGHVIYGTDSSPGSNAAFVHDLNDKSTVYQFTRAAGSIYGVSIEEKHLAYGGDDTDVYIHSAKTGPLDSNTQYEYRAVAEADNAMRKGRTQTFTTP